MNDIEILNKAIDKAIANGWNGEISILLNAKRDVILWDSFMIRGTILLHSFAKAFWGEEPNWRIQEDVLNDKKIVSYMEGGVTFILAWQYYLQQMVLEENPIKYLERFL